VWKWWKGNENGVVGITHIKWISVLIVHIIIIHYWLVFIIEYYCHCHMGLIHFEGNGINTMCGGGSSGAYAARCGRRVQKERQGRGEMPSSERAQQPRGVQEEAGRRRAGTE